MTSLPPALAAWAEPLSLFPPELALSLGQCIRRLAQAIGPLPRPAEEISNDPNGYEGLSRRGSYERLLISEWLLADEAPEEFLRRAAQREHAFLALSFHRPGGSRRSLVLFDAGPELIGEPRIGQLAALVVLSQRARRDGAAFGWGVLQDDRQQVTEEVTPASILRLLFSRTARPARAEDAQEWAKAAGEPLAADDLWVVGSPRTIAVGGPAAGRIELDDPLEPGKRDLLATIRRKGAAPRAMELPLPAHPDCVRLLRDPFSVRRAATRASPSLDRPPPATGIAFAQNGRRLLVRHDDGSVSAYPVPNSPRMPPGLPRRFELQAGEELVAAGWVRGSRVVLVRSANGYYVHGLQRQAVPPVYRLPMGVDEPVARATGHLSTLMVVSGPAVGKRPGTLHHAFLDAQGQWYALDVGPELRLRKVHDNVLACAERDRKLHILRWVATGTSHAIVHEVEGEEVARMEEGPGMAAFIGGDSPWIAVERQPDEWDVVDGSPARRRYTLQYSGGTVFGVTATPKGGHEPVLMVLDEDRRSVGLIGRSDYVPLLKAPSPIAQAVANGHGPEIALLGVDGAVTVLSPAQGKVLELKPAQVPLVQYNLAPRKAEP